MKKAPSSSNWKDKKEGKVNDILATLTAVSDDTLLHRNVSPQSTRDMDRSRIVLGTFLNTGSLAENIISEAAVRRSRIESYTTTDLKSVCSGLDNKCLTLIKSIDLFVHFPCHGDVTITHSWRMLLSGLL